MDLDVINLVFREGAFRDKAVTKIISKSLEIGCLGGCDPINPLSIWGPKKCKNKAATLYTHGPILSELPEHSFWWP